MLKGEGTIQVLQNNFSRFRSWKMLQGFEKEIQSTRKLTQITIEIVYKGFLRGAYLQKS